MSKLTIGQLAKRVGLRTSTLRYYEEQGLLSPAGRTEAGYRLYHPSAEQTLQFIQRAQRLGFSLADIRTMLHGLQENELSTETVVALAEERFIALERQLTELLVQRNELEHLLLEFKNKQSPESLFDRLLDRVCADPLGRLPADSILHWLAERTDCALAPADARTLLKTLRGQHVHVWQVKDGYHILVVGHHPAVSAALEQLTQLEVNCQVHPTPQLVPHEEGALLIARGPIAFIYARLFLALENE